MGKQKFNFQLNQLPVSSTAETQSPPQTDTDTVASIVQRLDSNDKNPFDIKLIPRNRIRANKKNNYPIEEIDSLAKSILEYGLQQNLVVIYSSEEDLYIIETGHRRATALNKLIDKYSGVDGESPEYDLYKKNVAPYEKGYPCRVLYLEDGIKYDVSDETDLTTVPVSVLDSEIRLYITNEEVRAKNPARTAQAVARLKQLYDAKNAKLNRSDKINVNNEIAENLNISSRQVAKYNSTDNLIPELRSLFINNSITLTSAAGYARLTPDDQMQIYKIFKEHDDLNTRQLNELIQVNNELDRKIKQQQTQIEAISSASDKPSDNSELLTLKKQIESLKAQKDAILSENSELKNKMMATRTLKSAYDDLIAAASHFMSEAKGHDASDFSCEQSELDKALSLSNQLSTLSLF